MPPSLPTDDRLSNILDQIVTFVNSTASGSSESDTLSRISAKISAWELVENAIKDRAARDLRDLNTLLPIHQIPTEIVPDIFEAALVDQIPSKSVYNTFTAAPDAAFHTYYQMLNRLRHVCYRWQKVADGSPRLWTRINGDFPNNIIDTALRKSASCPLDVYAATSGTFREDDFFGLIRKLDLHSNRLRTVSISYWGQGLTGSPEWQRACEFFSKDLPSLVSFNLYDRGTHTDFSNLESFFMQTPNLVELTLVNLILNYQTLSNILRDKPRLKSLYLENIGMGDFTEMQTTRRLQSDGPLLSTLSLMHLWPTFNDYILRNYRISKCRSLEIGLGAYFGPSSLENFIDNTMSSWLHQRVSAVTTISHVEVLLEGESVKLSYFGSTESSKDPIFTLTLCLRYHQAQATEIVRTTIAGVNKALATTTPTTAVHLLLGTDSFYLLELGEFVAELRGFKHVTQLELRWRPMKESWEAREADTFSLPEFPGLRELRVYHPPFGYLKKVVKLLCDGRNDEDEGIAIHIYVEQLVCEEMAELELERLKPVVGSTKVKVYVKVDIA